MGAPRPLSSGPAPGRGGAAPEARVVVVGAGPVGQTAALLLARHGVPVVLLDARPAREVVGSRATVHQRDVLDVWDWCGAGSIAREGLTWTSSRIFYRDRELLQVEPPGGDGSPLPPFVTFPQHRTEEVLDDLVRGSPLVDVRWGHEVEDLQQDPDGVVLTARTLAGPRRVRGRYVVACAGARGTVMRSLLGVAFPGRTFEDAFLVCDVAADGPPDPRPERHVHFDPSWHRGRQALVLPGPDATYRLDWQVDRDLDVVTARADGTLDHMVERLLGRPHEVRWASVYRFQARLASRLRVGDVFLAGDLAHLFPPFGARGLSSGVADVDNLAWKLAAVLHGWAPASLLDSYATERRAAALENQEVTAATMDFLVPRTPAQQARRRDLLEAAARDPALRGQVDGGRLAEPFWYVDSPLTTPDPARGWPGRPPLGRAPAPVPGVIVPDAAVWRGGPEGTSVASRLRSLVRGRVTVLTDGRHGTGAALAALRSVLPTGAPVAELDLTELRGGEVVGRALGWEPGDLWLVRPDAHTAARVGTLAALVVAGRRLIGTTDARGPVGDAAVRTLGP